MEQIIIEREIVIRGIVINIKSVFTGQTTLDEAMRKMVIRRLSEARNDTALLDEDRNLC